MTILIPPALRPSAVPSWRARGAAALLWAAAACAVAVPALLAVVVFYMPGWAEYSVWAWTVATLSVALGLVLALFGLHVLYHRPASR